MVKQFEIYWVSLDPATGSEIKKTRPSVIISSQEMNLNLRTVIIAPLTSAQRDFPTRVNVLVKGKKGQIALDQLRTIDKSRLGSKVSELGNSKILEVKAVLESMFQ